MMCSKWYTKAMCTFYMLKQLFFLNTDGIHDIDIFKINEN